MSEPYLPVPDPEEETTPVFQHACPECLVLLQSVQPTLDGRGGFKGWCPVHDWVYTITNRRQRCR